MRLEHDDDLRALVEEAAAELSVPGVSAGVLLGERALVATVGVTSTTDPLPVDEGTLFMIGSTSKTLTATALMALVDRGALSVKDRVVDHLPGFRLTDASVAQAVTVQQLLNHTSGWRGDLHPRTGWGEDALARALEEVAGAPQQLPLGAMASYSNSGFLVAGHLLATVHGTSFEQAVQELVLDPLGLDDSCYLPWAVAHRRHAVGHVVHDDGARPVTAWEMQRSSGPAGGLWSSLRDQLAYARYHLDGTTDGTAPLLEETRLLMQEPTVELRSGIEGIGLSWLLGRHGDVRLVSHGGNVSNLHTSTFVLVPDHGVAVTVMANSRHAPVIGAKVQAWALEQVGIPAPPARPTIPFAAAELAGVYDLGPFAWALTVSDGRLYVGTELPDDTPEEIRAAFAAPPRELVALEPDVLAFASDPVGPVLDVRRNDDGSVAGVVHGMRFAPRRP